MQRAKLFLENFIVYGLINVLNKFIPLLMLPIITRLLTDPSEFGVFDLYNTIFSFGLPLAMLGLYDAMFREHFEKDDQQYRYDVTSTAYRMVSLSSLIVGGVLILFNSQFSMLFFGTTVYRNIIIFAAFAIVLGNNTTIVSAPTRIENKRKIFVYSGLLHALSYYLLAVALVYLGYSYLGMIYANLIAAIILLAFFWVQNREFFTRGKFNKTIAKELLKVGVPLLPTFLIYWIYNSMDKLMIVNILGTNELGVFSIGARLASASMLIYSAFSGGWQYFSFSTMKDDDQVSMNANIFEYLGAVSYVSLIIIYPFLKIVFNLLFPGEYAGGVMVVPYLYLAPLLLMLFQVVANQFIIVKKSYWTTITLSVGAIANVILNWLMIPIFGIEGAAIATLIGYSLSVVVVSLVAMKLELHLVSKRFLAMSGVLLLYLVIARTLFYENVSGQIILSILCLAIYLVAYKEEGQLIWSQINQTLLQRKSQIK